MQVLVSLPEQATFGCAGAVNVAGRCGASDDPSAASDDVATSAPESPFDSEPDLVLLEQLAVEIAPRPISTAAIR